MAELEQHASKPTLTGRRLVVSLVVSAVLPVVGCFYGFLIGRALLILGAAACQSDVGLLTSTVLWGIVCGIAATLPFSALAWKRTPKGGFIGVAISLALFFVGYAAIFFTFLAICQPDAVS